MVMLLIAMSTVMTVLIIQHILLWRAVFGLRRMMDQGLQGLENQFDELSMVFSNVREAPTVDQIERAQYGLIHLMDQLEHFQKVV